MNTRLILSTMCVMSTILVGCSQKSQEVSERREDIDRQKAVQDQLVDKRTDELKEQVQRQSEDSRVALESDKSQLDKEKQLLDEQESALRKHSDFLKSDLDKQKALCKNQVERNADLAKDRINDFAATHQ